MALIRVAEKIKDTKLVSSLANSRNNSGIFTKKGPSQLIYSNREKDLLKEIFQLLVNKKVISKFEFQDLEKNNDKLDRIAFTLAKFGIATGDMMHMLKDMLVMEFLKGGEGQEATILRGNSLATKLSKVYLNLVGRDYLVSLLKPHVFQMCVEERKRSLEIDPRFCPDEMERKKNAEELIKKAGQILDTILLQENVDKMPPEMRVVSSYFMDLASEMHLEPAQKYPLVGGFLFLRFFNPAFLSPDQYGLMPEGKEVAKIPMRNLLLITKIIQNLSNGIEFGKKEIYMQVTNTFLKNYQTKVHQYFESVARFTQQGTFKCIPDDHLTINDFHHFHQLVTDKKTELCSLFDSSEDGEAFSQFLAKLGSYQSKTTFSFLSQNDRYTVSQALEQYRDEASYIGVVTKYKRSKRQQRILIIGHNRIITIRPNGKLARQAHLLDLREIISASKDDCELVFIGPDTKVFSISFIIENVDEIIHLIIDNYEVHFSSLPANERFKLSVIPVERIKRSQTPFDPRDMPCGGYVGMYGSLCNFYMTLPNEAVVWHFNHLPSTQKEFDLRRFTTNSLVPLASSDFGPLFWPLRFNSYFTSFTVKDYKMDKESLLDLAKVFETNTTLEFVRLRGVGGSSSAFSAIFEALCANKNCKIVRLDFSYNPQLDDKSVLHLGTYLSSSMRAIEYLKLNDTGLTGTGCKHLSLSLKERAKTKASNSIRFLYLSEVKLGPMTNFFTDMLQTATSLKKLYLANTQIVLDLVVDVVRKNCPQLENLDLSSNKLRPQDCKALTLYTSTSSSLSQLNLAFCKFPHDQLKTFLTSFSSQINVQLSLQGNELGPTGGKIISEIPFTMKNLFALDLDDNDFGDDVLGVLFDALCSNTSIQILSVSGNFRFKSERARRACIKGLANMINSNHTLNTLNIAGRPESDYCLKNDIIPVLYAMAYNNSLTSVDMSGHLMGNSGLIALSKVLQTNFVLSELKLNDNGVGLLGLINLSKALESNPSVKSLPISMSDIVSAMKKDDPLQLTKVLNEIQSSLMKNQ